ncbi:ABC transporter ATP-binding protein [Allorhizobium terrae]|uniref:ABC transporter ATP-binding protein n=1 Tax=Allorhizobium terrae TaxID=1848972 RepID=A0A4V3W7Z8_9HYPH|nr:ATP-binding cassette domain-containing protein [Allorhizobium terrae]THF49292.1 ABC transporter ATP-binding protein [Allorhizobium terrae]
MTVSLNVTNATVFTPSNVLVQPVNLALRAGRAFTILGETGSGKSLLTQAIMGTLPDGLIANGEAILDGNTLDLANPSGHRAFWGRKISILPQEPWLALDPTMRAGAQIAEGHRYVGGMTALRARAQARNDLMALDVADAEGKLPGELSGGMAQRVAFAAATTGGARIVIADEPTKGLDIARRDDVIALLMKEIEAGGTVLTITHDLALARQMGGDVAVMLNGRIVEQGETASVLADPAHAYTRRLIAADPENWHKTATRPAIPRDPILTARSLAKRRGGKHLFEALDVDIAAGEIVGVTGPSGSGKSTLGDILLGLLPPDTGSVNRPKAIARTRYQKLYQDPPSAFPAKIRIGTGLDDLIRLHRLDSTRIAPLMDRLHLSQTLLKRLPTEVSGGELQRFALLRALILDPVFLFADEPTSRLDLITQQETIQLLTELAREQNCAVLIVSHDPAIIEHTCDRRLDISRGTSSTGTVPHSHVNFSAVRHIW